MFVRGGVVGGRTPPWLGAGDLVLVTRVTFICDAYHTTPHIFLLKESKVYGRKSITLGGPISFCAAWQGGICGNKLTPSPKRF